MKKVFIALCSVALLLSCGGGKKDADGTAQTPESKEVAGNATPERSNDGEMAHGTPVASHEYVDLGLLSGTMWATCNVGATKPEELGGKYAWGEIEEKECYSWDNYKFCSAGNGKIIKYCIDSEDGRIDNKEVLEPADDVAHVVWGDDWCMPTWMDFYELRMECAWQWTSLNGVNGYMVTGPNGNSIFLPATEDNYDAFYWTSVLCTYVEEYVSGSSKYAHIFNFNSVDHYGTGSDLGRREQGYSVRPVRRNVLKIENEIKARLESLVKDLNTESHEAVNEKYLSSEFKLVLERVRNAKWIDDAKLENLYCYNNMWADIEGLGDVTIDVKPVDIHPSRDVFIRIVAGCKRFIADVKFGTSVQKTFLLVYENGNWFVGDIILANTQFGCYSIRDAISKASSNPRYEPDVRERNLMKVYVSMNNEIMVAAGKYAPKMFSVDELDGLRELAKEFITANLPGGVRNDNYPEPKASNDTISYVNSSYEELFFPAPYSNIVRNNKHVIALKVEPGVSYNSYMKVVEALCGAYCDLRAEFAEEVYDGAELDVDEKELCVNRFREMIYEGDVILEEKVVPPPPQSKKIVDVIKVVEDEVDIDGRELEEVKPLVIEKKVVPPPSQTKKIVDVIKIVEDEVEIEEEEITSVQDMSDYANVEDLGDFEYVEEEIGEEVIYDVAEDPAMFPGGDAALMKFLKNNLKYPRISRDNNSQGRAIVRFVVNTDGSIQNIEVIKSTGDMYLDKEAVRLVEIMPKWTPAKQSGKPVRVKYVLPVGFWLQ